MGSTGGTPRGASWTRVTVKHVPSTHCFLEAQATDVKKVSVPLPSLSHTSIPSTGRSTSVFCSLCSEHLSLPYTPEAAAPLVSLLPTVPPNALLPSSMESLSNRNPRHIPQLSDPPVLPSTFSTAGPASPHFPLPDGTHQSQVFCWARLSPILSSSHILFTLRQMLFHASWPASLRLILQLHSSREGP